jgi:Cu-Zn family superoxide dismutase
MKQEHINKIAIYILLLLILGYIIIYLISVLYSSMSDQDIVTAIAVFRTNEIYGDVIVNNYKGGVKVNAEFTKLPIGKHGFHIHKAGDLRGEGCQGLCEHYDIGKNSHGGAPDHKGERHTGDLGNIELKNGKFEKEYYIKGITVKDLWGRSIIVHQDEDDLGKGPFEDSLVTGHSGARIGCAIFGRGICIASAAGKSKNNKTRKNNK